MNLIPKTGASPVVAAVPPLTLPLSEARRLTGGQSPRLTCRAYWPVPKTLPNGLPCLSPLMADAQLVIGGGFRVIARVLRPGPGLPPSLLQIEQAAFDVRLGRWVRLPPYAPEIVRAAYDVLASRQVLLNARQNARKARN